MSYGYEYPMAAQAAPVDRATFIRRTYAHLAGAILAFVGLEALLLQIVTPQNIVAMFGGGSPIALLLVFGMFIFAGWIAQTWARSETSIGMQYLGLALYVVVEAVIFLPLLYVATHFIKDQTLIPTAGILTLSVFGGLTLAVFVTGKDYTPLGPILTVGSMIAIGVIICAILFTFTLGLVFSFFVVALMSGYILYDTSNIMLYHRTDQHVGAALDLFADVATMFYWILRILMILNSRD